MDPVTIGVRVASWVKGVVISLELLAVGWILAEVFAHGQMWIVALTVATGLAGGELYAGRRLRQIREATKAMTMVKQWADLAKK